MWLWLFAWTNQPLLILHLTGIPILKPLMEDLLKHKVPYGLLCCKHRGLLPKHRMEFWKLVWFKCDWLRNGSSQSPPKTLGIGGKYITLRERAHAQTQEKQEVPIINGGGGNKDWFSFGFSQQKSHDHQSDDGIIPGPKSSKEAFRNRSLKEECKEWRRVAEESRHT